MTSNEMETALNKQGIIDNSGAGSTIAAEARAENSFQKWLKWAESANGVDEARMIRSSLLWATRNIKAAKHAVWIVEQGKKNAAIKSAILEHSVLPDNYWQAEHRAWIAFESASKMLTLVELELGVTKDES